MKGLPLGYLPDSRRLWAWSTVFGGSFLEPTTNQLTVASTANVAALNWMSGHYERVGIERAIAFRSGDQSLPGKTFPLLPVRSDQNVGRYVMMMDGQWRVRDINRFLAQRETEGLPTPEFGVCSLPIPSDDTLQPRTNAGWVNGNFFVVPTGAKKFRPERGSSSSSGSGWMIQRPRRKHARQVAGFRFQATWSKRIRFRIS